MRVCYGVEIVAFVSAVGGVELWSASGGYPVVSDPATNSLLGSITREEVDTFIPVRCPDKAIGAEMEAHVAKLRDEGDSTGGMVTCVLRGVPPGIGEPVFEKLEARLAQGMMSIPASIAFSMGGGCSRRRMRGSEHNDAFATAPDGADAREGGIQRSRLVTKTNFSGGIQGGITNGMPIYFSVEFKPPATISQAQETVSYGGVDGRLEAKGRHDPCVVPRAVPIVESMAALVVMDALMVQHSREVSKGLMGLGGGK